jgi:hypothetical protein
MLTVIQTATGRQQELTRTVIIIPASVITIPITTQTITVLTVTITIPIITHAAVTRHQIQTQIIILIHLLLHAVIRLHLPVAAAAVAEAAVVAAV